MNESLHIAIIGGGMAGVVCARTLGQSGHRVTLFEKSRGLGGRMSTRSTEFGTFDHGTQYFTVRDLRFAEALETVRGLCRPWSANAVRVLDAYGQTFAAALPNHEPHWVPVPGMNELVRQWGAPLVQEHMVRFETLVTHIEPDHLYKQRWQLKTEGPNDEGRVFSGFDRVVLAMPAPQARQLLQRSKLANNWLERLGNVELTPCWTLMLAFPQAMQPGLGTLGPQWNAARSTHHRISWLARENSKPGRPLIERWTVQASAQWSKEHLEDHSSRVQSKLLKAFAEVTGILAEPSFANVHRWRYAQTQEPLGKSYLWDKQSGIGLCGDWCLGHRVENAFVSGLELALKIS
jgi:predicted NAD/FAD-dependent oxidoreductase